MTQIFSKDADSYPSNILSDPSGIRNHLDRLIWKREERLKEESRFIRERDKLRKYLSISGKVSDALESLSNQLFKQRLITVEEKLTIALQEILEQPIKLCAEPEFQRGSASVTFYIDRGGYKEHAYKAQGGSVANILSVGLRMFALTTLDPAKHRRFLVLDEQDCWLHPDLVPKLVKIVSDAGKALGFQVLMISHHDLTKFEQYADKIYEFIPISDGAVEVREVAREPDE